MKRNYFVLAAVLFFLIATSAWGDPVVKELYYQKKTTLSYPATYTFRFSLWDKEVGGNEVWSEEKTVRMTSATIRTYLGEVSSLGEVDFSQQLWVQVEQRKKNGTYKAVGEVDMLGIVPYAMWAMSPAGEKGDKGDPGPQGEMGPVGPQGAKGDKGDTGPQGLLGPIGATGPEGPQGPQGPKGDTGDIGPMGPQGPAGLQGEKGDKGDKGDTGAVGITFTGAWDSATEYVATDVVTLNGETWLAINANQNSEPAPGSMDWELLAAIGAAGPQGPQGEMGPVGPQGPKGDKGDTGPQGLIGPIGATGPEGSQGPQGPKGDTGDTGPMGPQGEIGPTGPQGTPGMVSAYYSTNSASGTTTSRTYTANLTGGGTSPSVTVTTGTSAIVMLAASINGGYMSVAVSGNTTISASDERALSRASNAIQAGAMYVITGLTPGSNTFTLQYKSSGGTVTVSNRNIIVMPL